MTSNLQALVWVLDENSAKADPTLDIAYALDALYVYRREIDLSQEVPRPRYWRASHRNVLANERGWGDLDPGIWTECDETGKPLTRLPQSKGSMGEKSGHVRRKGQCFCEAYARKARCSDQK